MLYLGASLIFVLIFVYREKHQSNFIFLYVAFQFIFELWVTVQFFKTEKYIEMAALQP